MSKNAPATKVERKKFQLKNVRLSYPNLFKAKAMKAQPGEEEKAPEFSASFILDKTNPEHKKVVAAIETECKRIATEKWGKVPPAAKFKTPVRDGETFVDEATGEIKDGHSEDTWGISAKSKAKQHVVGRDKQPIGEDEIYGGCYVNAVITLYPWKHPTGGWGVSANLGPVQFFKNGERFGGTVLDPDEEFEDLGEDDDGDEPEEKPKKAAKGKKAAAADDDDEDEFGL